MASARRKSGSASASRLVSLSSPARLLRPLATLGYSGPEFSPAGNGVVGCSSARPALACDTTEYRCADNGGKQRDASLPADASATLKQLRDVKLIIATDAQRRTTS